MRAQKRRLHRPYEPRFINLPHGVAILPMGMSGAHLVNSFLLAEKEQTTFITLIVACLFVPLDMTITHRSILRQSQTRLHQI